MREKVTEFIKNYAKKADEGGIISYIWREPLVYFGDARRPELVKLRELIHPEHDLPWEVLPEAKTIVAYFLPFRKEIGDTNKSGRLSSAEWAKAYEKTNATILEINLALIKYLQEQGIMAAISPESGSYDDKLLLSKWSQRHLAYYCGMGTFGINNMLITEAGCCGRVSTVVTALDVEWDPMPEMEYCLYKRNGSCGKCVKHCPAVALTAEDGKYAYDRNKCNGLCDENAAVHVGYCEKPSYQLEDTSKALVGSNTCGKCVVGMPCTYRIPKR